MTSSEYKNTIEWTLSVQTPKDEDNVTTTKRILTNLGVPFPHGTLDEAVNIVNTLPKVSHPVVRKLSDMQYLSNYL